MLNCLIFGQTISIIPQRVLYHDRLVSYNNENIKAHI